MAVDSPPSRFVEEVADSIWEEISPTPREDTDTDKKLMSGKTLFIEGSVSSFYQRADRRGYTQKARKSVREGRKGSYVKWERRQRNG